MAVQLYSFFKLGAKWGGWSTPRPGRFTPGKEARYLLYRRLGGRRGWSGRARKVQPPPGQDPQPVASRFTDYDIPASQNSPNWPQKYSKVNVRKRNFKMNVGPKFHWLFFQSYDFSRQTCPLLRLYTYFSTAFPWLTSTNCEVFSRYLQTNRNTNSKKLSALVPTLSNLFSLNQLQGIR